MILTLADLELAYRNIYEELENNGGELTEELQDALAINDNDFEDRVENYHLIINQNNSDIDRLKLLISNANKKVQAKTKVNEYLKGIIKEAVKRIVIPTQTKAMLNTYAKDFRDIKVVVSPSQSVDIIDLEAIKEAGLGKYAVDFDTNDENVVNRIKKAFPNMEIKAIFQPDKTEISNKIKAKEVVKGAELQTNYNINFK